MDDFSLIVWIFPLHNKTDTTDVFQSFKAMATTKFSLPIKDLQTDNGSEFKPCIKQLESKRILHMFTCSHYSDENKGVEPRHRRIVKHSLSAFAVFGIFF